MTIFGTGSDTRDYVYVDDVVEAQVRASEALEGHARIRTVVEKARLHVHIRDLRMDAIIHPGTGVALPFFGQVAVRAGRDKVRATVHAELPDLDAEARLRIRHRHRAHGLIAHARVKDELVAGLRLRRIKRRGPIEDAIEHGARTGEILGRHRLAVRPLNVDADRHGEAAGLERRLARLDEPLAVGSQKALRVDEGRPIVRTDHTNKIEAMQPYPLALVKIVAQL
ncbi:MAG: NAD-dependent epimerase/dehydratase family protein [Elusimicrobiota bacterium]